MSGISRFLPGEELIYYTYCGLVMSELVQRDNAQPCSSRLFLEAEGNSANGNSHNAHLKNAWQTNNGATSVQNEIEASTCQSHSWYQSAIPHNNSPSCTIATITTITLSKLPQMKILVIAVFTALACVNVSGAPNSDKAGLAKRDTICFYQLYQLEFDICKQMKRGEKAHLIVKGEVGYVQKQRSGSTRPEYNQK
ncbi:hypothetical protein GQ42DRAFT_155041 [Ramicandelaber brevisporus]|nr:hypothetical protein GQ42DRAFT_155041 [Ramicandelaber brevisporus]